MIFMPTLCVACRHRIGDDPEACTSFPEGIPEGIVAYGEDHRRSIGGEEPFELDPAKDDLFQEWAAYNSPT